jgi:hypothetical protein
VQQGDTLLSIASKFDVTAQAIALANHVRPGQVQPGQTLTIPALDSTTEIADPTIGADSGIGELVIEYPAYLMPGAKAIVRAAINVPDIPASVTPDMGTVIIRLPTQEPVPQSPSEARTPRYATWIVVLPEMRAALTAKDLQITPITTDTQVVNIYELNSRTQWMWEVAAPAEAGEAYLVLRAGGQDAPPLWTGSIQTQVLAPAPTPEPTPTPTLPPTPVPTATRGPYVLLHSSFEEEFYDYQGTGELTVPNGWVPVWVQLGPEIPLDQLNRPEYDFKDRYRGHTEVRTGRFAAAVFTVFATHDTALYREFKVEPGRLVRASVWAMGVSHARDGRSGGLGTRIGLDPTGGTDPKAPTVVYSRYWSSHLTEWREREWHNLEVAAFAQADTITVFLASIADWPVDINASHWDDLVIQVE